MQAGYGSDKGRVRATNEDALWCDDRLIVVADGMGGAAAGEVASRLAVETVRGWRFPSKHAPIQNVKEEVERSIHAANQEIYDRALRHKELQGMGTTLTMAFLLPAGTAIVAHVGDSRAYLFTQNRLSRITQDHSVVGELVRSGGILPSQAEHHPYRNLLTRALGTSRHVDVDIERVRLGPRDALLLCTDGLTGLVSDDEMETIIAESKEAQAAVDALISLANERGGPDNITAVLIYPGGAERA